MHGGSWTSIATFTVLLYVGAVEGNNQCQVNRTHVTCTRFTSTNPLLQITDERVLRDLDTVVINNAKLDLTMDLVDYDITMPRVSLMDLKKNQITRMGQRGFAKTRNTEYLYLSHNNIQKVQPNAFVSLTRLRLLEMNDALADGFGDSILRNLFDSNNPLVDLVEIQLNNNSLRLDYSQNTFCKIKGLRRLELANNNIENLDFAKKCFSSVKALNLAGNKLTTIPEDIWDMMSGLTSLDISNNPIHCDCSVYAAVQDETTNFINQEKTICASPANVKGKSIFDLPKDFCEPRGFSFLTFLLLALVAGAALFVYKRYRDRFVPGYEAISRNVEPQFV